MSNWDKDSILKFLYKEAPKAPLARCMSLAHDLDGLKKSEFFYKTMLSALSPLLLTDNGEILPQYKDVRPGIKKALETVSNCHSWTVCGPVQDGLERMLCDVEGVKYSPPKPTERRDT